MRFEKFTIKSQEALSNAQSLAEKMRHPAIECEHLLYALLIQEGGLVQPILKKLGVPTDMLISNTNELLKKMPTVSGMVQLSISHTLSNVLEKSFEEADKLKDEYVSTEHLLLALFSEREKLFKNFGITKEQLLQALKEIRGSGRVTDQSPEEKFQALEKYCRDLTDAAKKGKLDPVIGRDEEIRRVIQVLSRRTKNNPVLIGEPGVGKTAIVEGLAQRIINKDVPEGLKDKRLLALDLGALVAGAKFRGEFEERLKAVLKEVLNSNGQIVMFIDELHNLVGTGRAEGSMDASNMLKPALARGELHCVGATTLDEYRKYIEKDAALERRFQTVFVGEPSVEDTISILRGLKEKYEVHHGVRIKDEALIAAANLSNRYISDRFLPDKAIDLIDEAASKVRVEIDSMPAEIDQLQREIMQIEIEKQALSKEGDKSALVRIGELDKELTELKKQSNEKKKHWHSEKNLIKNISSIKEEIEKARTSQVNYEREGNLEKIAEIKYGLLLELQKKLDAEKSALSEFQKDEKILTEEVDADIIAEIVSKWTKIPVSKMMEGEIEKLLKMEERLKLRVVGQDEAVQLVSDAVRRGRSGISDPGRPVGSFIFLGPTGVGKTELAKALAEFLFDDEQAIVRIDMSEFMEKHSVSRLIGAPPGYVGYEEGGYLTEAVRRKPYSVILLDEIEKAHPDVFNILLQILDDGRLTDNQGRTVDFKNTLIIMTSNLGGSAVGGLGKKDSEKEVIKLVRSTFKPEFLNRVDEILIFNRLEKSDIVKIVDIQFLRLVKRVADSGITITLNKKAKEYLADAGYDPVYGARPLKRAIQKYIENPLSVKLLKGEFVSGDKVEINVKDKNLVFECKKERDKN